MKRFRGGLSSRILALMTILLTLVGVGTMSAALPQQSVHAQASGNACRINAPRGKVQHVIYLQFDNTHFTRDNPNIPSDLEQMPNLLNFIKSKGALLSNDHTPLIAHTGTDILTSITGVYGERHGMPVSNSYRYFNPDGSSSSAASFAYWTAPVFDSSTTSPSDTTYTMLSAANTNAPAPWVPYTRAGCNFGAVGTANSVLENTGIDIPTIFGSGSAQAAEAGSNPKQAAADFVGIGVHCAQGNALCAPANSGQSDKLPNEPGGYTGYQGLFGYKYVAPQINPQGPLTDLDGNVIKDASGNTGFPGFDGMSASVALSYVAAMQEHNVPVTYAYISDAHDRHPTTTAYGPGEAGYVAALKAYDSAFGKFFSRLAHDGINASNTLFVFTADEGDHFVGSAPNPANCDGVTIPCTYSNSGEINVNLTGLLATKGGITTRFNVHADSSPTVYIDGNPARDAVVTRQFERATAALTASNPLTGKDDKLTNYMADPVEMKLLHMVTADPARTPTFTLFANPDYYLATGTADCNTPCVVEKPAFAWNHGDVASDINTTWLGIVGPGVRNIGVDSKIWADHTDVRPTMLALLGLKDDYRHDGRALFEVFAANALPTGVRSNLNLFVQLAQVYKQINAPLGHMGLTTLKISTTALASNTGNDSTYRALEGQLQSITDQRNTTANKAIDILNGATFGGMTSTQQVQSLIAQSNNVIKRVDTLAGK